MKKIILSLGIISLFISCQDELYEDDLKSHTTKQGIYIDSKETLQIFTQENKDIDVPNINVKLVKPMPHQFSASITAGDESQLNEYNKKNNTNYSLLPSSMYEITKQVNFKATDVTGQIALKLKNVKFPEEGTFALPIKIQGGNGYDAISGQDQTLLILEQEIATKVLKINGAGTEIADVFGVDHKVAQWTLEMMVKRSAYTSNNKAIGGTKDVDHPKSEIYTRFGDVTIKPNQLQIKTGGSQIDIDADKLSAEPNKWYALAFWYDGKTTKVFVNGVEVASREIADWAYSVTGFWISGSNEFIREVRFWKRAVSPKELQDNLWKVLNPKKAEGLLFYYPMNGKKYDHETGEITDDETKIWDWSSTKAHLNMPVRAKFDDNEGNSYVFPPK